MSFSAPSPLSTSFTASDYFRLRNAEQHQLSKASSDDSAPSSAASGVSSVAVASSSDDLIGTQPRKSIRGGAVDGGNSGSVAGGQQDHFGEGDDGDTFYELLSIHLDQSVNSMSISPASRDVALGARKGLFIVDLQNPYDPPRFLPHHSPWEVADVQWNPFPARSEWVVSTSNQKVLVYNLSLSPSLSVSPIEHTLHAHTRAVTDINWSSAYPEILATCALDGWVHSWDLRTGYGTKSGAGGGRKPVWSVCSWGPGATQVKWNRRDPHYIASAHDNQVFIWDDRMGAEPVTKIEGHTAKIYGIDWSRRESDKLVTCSLDKSFKSWSINDTSESDLTVITSSPVWRARYTPFGAGILTLPQRSDHALSIWGRAKLEADPVAQPVARFLGANAGVKEFVWRTRGGNDPDSDDRQFQLVTWAKDRRLRLWPISDEILKEVGHEKGAKITIPVTRRHATNISYRTFAGVPALPPAPLAFPTNPFPRHLTTGTPSLLTSSIPASPAGPSLLTSSLLSAGFAGGAQNFVPAPPAPAERSQASAMMTTAPLRNRRQKAHDRLTWMEGVKVHKTSNNIEHGYGAEVTTSGMDSVRDGGTRASSVVRGTDGGTAREGGETERGAESVMSPGSIATNTAVGKEPVHANLGEEITSAVRKFHRVTFEKVQVAGRTCTVSLRSPRFIRATFTFPKNYPLSAPPIIEIERNAEIPLKARAFLLQNIRTLMSQRSARGIPSFEQALKFLLGDRDVLDASRREMEKEDDDSDDEVVEAMQGLTMGVAGGMDGDILRNNINVPPPRRGGAVFGPSGQLVVFFPTDVFSTAQTDYGTGSSDAAQATKAVQTTDNEWRLSEAFGTFSQVARDVLDDEGYQETDEALQMDTDISYRSSAAQKPAVVASTEVGSMPSWSDVVHIKSFAHLTILSPSTAPRSLTGSPIEIAREALATAVRARDVFLITVWTTLECFFDFRAPLDPEKLAQRGFHDRLIPQFISMLVHLKNVQTLGIIACLLESYRRAVFDNPQPSDQSPSHSISTVDYFSSRIANSSNTTPYDSRTPLASGYRPARESNSTINRSSWASLGGLFNASVLSLRSTGGSPRSPDAAPEHQYVTASAPPGSPSSRPASSSGGPRSFATTPATPYSPVQQHPLSRRHSDSPDSVKKPLTTPTMRPAIGKHNSRHRDRRLSPSVVSFGNTVDVINEDAVAGSPIPSAPAVAVKRSRGVRVVLPGPQATIPRPAFWWSSERAQIELEVFRLAYARLLQQWELDHLRLEVLKLCRSAAQPSLGSFVSSVVRAGNGFDAAAAIEYRRACIYCQFGLREPYTNCTTCHRRQRRSDLCTLCHNPITQLSISCNVCLHVGHLDCLKDWYAKNDSCPTGCGCSCVSSGGTSGVFMAAPPKPVEKEKVAPSKHLHHQRPPPAYRSSMPFFA